MDRYSHRLAASIIGDRHREAARRRSDVLVPRNRTPGRRRNLVTRATAAVAAAVLPAGGSGLATNSRAHQREKIMRTLRSRIAALLAAGTILAISATSVAAVPVERTRSTVECLGSSVTLIMHPGEGGIVQWDISTENVRNKPSLMIKSLTANVFTNGEPAGTFSASIGEKVGFGTPLNHAPTGRENTASLQIPTAPARLSSVTKCVTRAGPTSPTTPAPRRKDSVCRDMDAPPIRQTHRGLFRGASWR